MKKIFLMLLGVAATVNMMAVDYTAKATITIKSSTGYYRAMMLQEASEFGALNGAVMNFDDSNVALYGINGSKKLQVVKGANLDGTKLGLMTDAGTEYTLTVSSVEGAETLYIWDADSASYALTEGAVYHFTAVDNATDEARFVIKKAAMSVKGICFSYEKLQITDYAGAQVELLNYADKASVMAPVTIAGNYQEIKLEDVAGLVANTQYIVKLTPVGETAKEYVITYKAKTKPVTPAP